MVNPLGLAVVLLLASCSRQSASTSSQPKNTLGEVGTQIYGEWRGSTFDAGYWCGLKVSLSPMWRSRITPNMSFVGFHSLGELMRSDSRVAAAQVDDISNIALMYAESLQGYRTLAVDVLGGPPDATLSDAADEIARLAVLRLSSRQGAKVYVDSRDATKFQERTAEIRELVVRGRGVRYRSLLIFVRCNAHVIHISATYEGYRNTRSVMDLVESLVSFE